MGPFRRMRAATGSWSSWARISGIGRFKSIRTLNFKNNKVSGSAGCNTYLGPYTEESRGKLHI
ncbi:MAG: META domain-containing protein, partial [Candidatus Electrothrix sp. AX5]|nr:META domain-containing protein [Candidatus Electrothrix sp. AX5]